MSFVRAAGATNRLSRHRLSVPRVSALGFGLLAASSWSYILMGGNSGFADLIDPRTWQDAWRFVAALAGQGMEGTPAFLDSEAWKSAFWLSLDTLAMSVLAIGLATGAVLATFLPGARNVAFGQLSGSRFRLGWVVFAIVRGLFALTRGIPELLWAMLLVFVFSPGVLVGALALAIHNYGILGKLSAEIVEDMDPRPARALRAAGASNLQMLAYGVLPQALPQMMTYMLYRWEVVIRTTIVVGFVSAGGLGREFRLAMSWFQYDRILLFLIWYLMLVLLVDVLSIWLRRLAK